MRIPKFIKKLYHLARIPAYKIFRDFPLSVTIENTTACNRSCPYCPHNYVDREVEYMDSSVFEKIINDLRKMEFNGMVSFSPFGECLLDDRLESFISFAREKLPQAKIKVMSNGDLLDYDRLMSLLEAGVDNVTVSFHYFQENGELKRSDPEKALETFSKLRKEQPELLQNGTIKITKKNYERMSRKCTFHNRCGLVPLENTISHQELYGTCGSPYNIMEINYRGEVLLCCKQWPDIENPSFGNVMDENLKKIWESEEFERTRIELLKGKFSHESCKNCGRGYLNMETIDKSRAKARKNLRNLQGTRENQDE